MPRFLPARLVRTRSITVVNTASGRIRPWRRRCAAPHRDQELNPLRTGPGSQWAASIAPTTIASATTRPLRRRCAAHYQDQELTPLKAGPGSGRESRAVQVRPTPRDRPPPQQGHTMGKHRWRSSRQSLTGAEYRNRYRMLFFGCQSTRATDSSLGSSAPATCERRHRSGFEPGPFVPNAEHAAGLPDAGLRRAAVSDSTDGQTPPDHRRTG